MKRIQVGGFSRISDAIRTLIVNLYIVYYPLTPLCVACKYKRIFGVLGVLKIRKMDPDILACNYVRIYLHASLTYFPNDF